NTNLRPNRRHRQQAYSVYRLGPKGHGEQVARLNTEPRRRAGSLPIRSASSSTPANSKARRPAQYRNEERGNPTAALRLVPEQVSTACGGRVGLPKKRTPRGKPGDMLTWARFFGR